MINKDNNLVSLNELSKQLNINKSQLSYYVSLGLLMPITVVGRMNIFNKEIALKNIKEIKKWQKESYTLEQIKIKMTK
jgi:DNA-binding transcriptional MerR regulator